MCLGLSGHISTSFRCTPVTHGSALTSLNLGCTRHSRSTLHSALICTRFPGTRALCVASCPVKTRGKLSHHIGAPRRSGAWKALLLVTEGNALGPHVRPISICLEGSTPQDRTSPRNEICPTRPNPCFKSTPASTPSSAGVPNVPLSPHLEKYLLGIKKKDIRWGSGYLSEVRCLADSNRRRRFCRPVTKPLIQGTIL